MKVPETVNIHQAKTHLSRLLARVSQGEEFVIAKAGKPVAKLAPVQAKPSQRVPGFDKGKISMASDFEAPLPEEILNEFYK